MNISSLSFACVLLIPGVGFGQESTEDTAAKIQFEIDRAKAEVDKKYEGRTEKELTPEERIEKARDENDAASAVLEKNGTDAKSFTYLRAKMGGGEDHEAVKSGQADKDFSKMVKDLKKKDEEAKSKKPEEPAPIVVEKGPIVENEIAPEDEVEVGGAAKSSPKPPSSKGKTEPSRGE